MVSVCHYSVHIKIFRLWYAQYVSVSNYPEYIKKSRLVYTVILMSYITPCI